MTTHRFPLLDEALRQEIQSRAAELIGAQIPLQRAGKRLMGRCPFHTDTTPSLSVSPQDGLFHCFGCGAGGDALTFLMRFTGLRFPEAVREAARLLGLPLAQADGRARAPLAAVAETAATCFEAWLWGPDGQPGRAYLHQRGIREETARRFRLGFQPPDPARLVRALTAKGVSLQAAAMLGLLTRQKGQWQGMMGGRLLFPILDAQGQVRGFGARALSSRGPKYLNSPDSPLFHKRQLLYGLAQGRSALREQKAAIVVEGYFDVLALHQAGFHTVVAPLSTTLTQAHLTLLRPCVERVTLLFDGDAAGVRGVMRAIGPAEAADVPIAVATLPPRHDPDSYLSMKSRAALENILAQAQPLAPYVLQQLVAQHGKARAAQETVELSSTFIHPVARLSFLQQAEEVFHFPAGSLLEAAGMGSAARQRLEAILCDLLQTIPAVRQRLRGRALPIADPRLRARATQTLQREAQTAQQSVKSGAAVSHERLPPRPSGQAERNSL